MRGTNDIARNLIDLTDIVCPSPGPEEGVAEPINVCDVNLSQSAQSIPLANPGFSSNILLEAAHSRNDSTPFQTLYDIDNQSGSLRTTGKLGGAPCDFIVDTGASISIVSSRLIRKDQPLRGSSVVIYSVTGELIPVAGSVNLVVELGDTLIAQNFTVATIGPDCILGVDFFLDNGCVLDFRRRKLQVVDSLLDLSPPAGTRCAFVTAHEEETLPPNSETMLLVANPLLNIHENVIVEQGRAAELPVGVFVGRTICEGSRDLLPIRLCNTTSSPVTINRRAELAEVEGVIIDEVGASSLGGEVPDSWSDFDIADENLSVSQKDALVQLLHKYNHIFSKSQSDMGRTNMATHSIDTGNSRPIRVPPRRLPIPKMEEARRLVKDMADRGVIQPSKSPWAAPVVLVRKKDGTLRFCVDYRRLNEVTKKDSYPLPRMDSILTSLNGSEWFSTLDLQSGYWQVAMSPKDCEKTAFTVDRGLWEFLVMPFGLCNAPATFERLMDRVFDGVSWQTALVYLDDIIVHGRSFEDHLANLEIVFQKLQEANLRLGPSKCHLFRRSVKYLGHVVSKEGLSADSDKCRAIETWPVPTTKTQLRSFLGLCSYYRRFVRDFSSIAKPLTQLTEKARTFVWDEQCSKAFLALKTLLTEPPILAFPDPELKFILDTDASHAGIGAVLSQEQGGKERVLEYFSSTFSGPERNYCVTRKELLAVVRSVKHFHHYLFGRSFTLRTDHSSLRWLTNFKEPEGQLARWIERLAQYDFVIIHRPGVRHGNADALSRRPCVDCAHCQRKEMEAQTANMNLTVVDTVNWKLEQSLDPDLSFLMSYLVNGTKPDRLAVLPLSPAVKSYWAQWESLSMENEVLLFRDMADPRLNPRIVVPKHWTKILLKELHESNTGGHFGIAKTISRLKSRYYWIGLRRDVEFWCRNCHTCKARSGPVKKTRGPMQLYVVGAPFERIAVDILGPLPTSASGNRYITVVMDYFSKWPEAFATPDQTAETVIEGLVDNVITRFGVPFQLHSDQGRNFEATVFRGVLERLGVEKTRTTPLHPQSDGMVERFNRTLLNYLSKFVDGNQRNWDKLLPLALMSYRSAQHDATGFTPALMNFGRELRLPPDVIFGLPPDASVSSESEYVSRLMDDLNEVHKCARSNLNVSSERMKTRYDLRSNPKRFDVGAKVWLYNPSRRKGLSPKLQSDWEGPCLVMECLSSVVYRIKTPSRRQSFTVHIDRLAPYEVVDTTDT